MPADVAGLRPVLTFNMFGRLQRVSLPKELAVGRAPSCDLVLDHAFVSARHCSFSVGQGGVAVEDHSSSNGTRVNGAAITGKVPLASGDVIEVGPYVFTLGFTGEKPSLPPPAPPREKPLISLGPQMATMTERPTGAPRTIVEVVDGPRPRGTVARTAFRDAVKRKGGATVAIVGDIDPCEDAGEVFGALRQTLRDLVTAGAELPALATGLSELLAQRRRRARVVLALVDPVTSKVRFINAHDGEPYIARGQELMRLEGERARTFGTERNIEGPVHERELGKGEVLVLTSASLVMAARLVWPLEPPFVGKSQRAATIAMWLVNQAAKSGEPGCAICVEIASEPRS